MRKRFAVEHETLLPAAMTSPVDRLNELPPLPRRTPTPRRTGRYLLLLVTVLLVANAIIGERGLLALFQTSRDHSQLRKVIATLHEENNQLHRYIKALTAEPRFLENEARRELGMIKPGEQLFLIRTAPPTFTPAISLAGAPTDTAAN